MPSAGVYASSKAAVVTLTECLAHQLKELDSRIGASVLFPSGGLLLTGLWTSDRNRRLARA
jgi:NAD(P)-dependent dehydrogenase (short-subunit alcohol dehydrogenase family)